jgi:hypothetical protein
MGLGNPDGTELTRLSDWTYRIDQGPTVHMIVEFDPLTEFIARKTKYDGKNLIESKMIEMKDVLPVRFLHEVYNGTGILLSSTDLRYSYLRRTLFPEFKTIENEILAKPTSSRVDFYQNDVRHEYLFRDGQLVPGPKRIDFRAPRNEYDLLMDAIRHGKRAIAVSEKWVQDYAGWVLLGVALLIGWRRLRPQRKRQSDS